MKKILLSATLLLVSFSSFADSLNILAGQELSQVLKTGTTVGNCLVLESDFNEMNDYVLKIEQKKEAKKKGIFKRFKKFNNMVITTELMIQLKSPTYYSSQSNESGLSIYAIFSNNEDVYKANKSLTLRTDSSRNGSDNIAQLTVSTDTGVTINCVE